MIPGGTWPRATVTLVLGLLACTALVLAVNRPVRPRVVAAALLVTAHCAWAVLVLATLDRQDP